MNLKLKTCAVALCVGALTLKTAVAQVGDVRLDKTGKVQNPNVDYPLGVLKQAGNVVERYAFREIGPVTGAEIDRRLLGLTAGAAAQNLYSSRNDSGSGTYVRSITHFLHDLNQDLTCTSVYSSAGLGANGTLISPRHIVLAHHSSVANGTTFRFVTASGTVVLRTLSSSTQVGTTDIQIGLLNSDVPGTITPAKILRNENLKGGVIITVEQNQVLGVADVLYVYDVTGGVTLYNQTPPESNRVPFYHFGVSGDSGHPWFTVVDGRLVLLTSFFSSVSGPLYGHYFDAVNAVMTSLGGGYQLTDIGVARVPVVLDDWTNRRGQPGDVPALDSTGKLKDNWLPSVTAPVARGLADTTGNTPLLTIEEASGPMQFSADISDFNFQGGDAQKTAFRAAIAAPDLNGGRLYFPNTTDVALNYSDATNSSVDIAGSSFGTDGSYNNALGTGDAATATWDSSGAAYFYSLTSTDLRGINGTGTDAPATEIAILGGASTGTGRGGAIRGRTANSSTTGSTTNQLSTRFYHSAKYVDLTESTATLIGNISLPGSKYLGARLNCTVTANDGTEFQSLNSSISFSAVNKAGSIPAITVTNTHDTANVSSGTLTATYTAIANGNSVDIKCNAVSSLTQTVLRCKWSILSLNTDDTGAVTPQ